MKRIFKAFYKVAAVAAVNVLSAGVATATPVTYMYNSGSFTPSIYLDSSVFGPNFIATFTFSDNFSTPTPGIASIQCLYKTGDGSSLCDRKTPIATLLNYSITSGNYTLDATNSSFANTGYPGFSFAEAIDSTGHSRFELLFEADGNASTRGLVVDGRSGIGVNDINQIEVSDGLGRGGFYIGRNQSGGTFTSEFGYTGPGGIPGGGGGGTRSVPEPNTIALVLLGMGGACWFSRQRSKKPNSFRYP